MEMWRCRIHPEDLERSHGKFDRAKRERGIFSPNTGSSALTMEVSDGLPFLVTFNMAKMV